MHVTRPCAADESSLLPGRFNVSSCPCSLHFPTWSLSVPPTCPPSTNCFVCPSHHGCRPCQLFLPCKAHAAAYAQQVCYGKLSCQLLRQRECIRTKRVHAQRGGRECRVTRLRDATMSRIIWLLSSFSSSSQLCPRSCCTLNQTHARHGWETYT